MEELRFEVNPSVEEAELNALFFAAWPGHSRTDFRRRLDRGLGHVCAFAGDRLIGFAHLSWDGGAHAFLLDPTVHPKHRRQGIGRELVRRVHSRPRRNRMVLPRPRRPYRTDESSRDVSR